jgi:hypothetical protein
LGGKPGTDGFDVVEGGSAAGYEVPYDGAKTHKDSTAVIQVDRHGEEARLG